jgi:hypothetical protein
MWMRWSVACPAFALLAPKARAADALESEESAQAPHEVQPFLHFAQSILPQTPLRAAITAAWHRPETECLPALLPLARVSDAEQADKVHALAAKLVQGLRDAPWAAAWRRWCRSFPSPAKKAWR